VHKVLARVTGRAPIDADAVLKLVAQRNAARKARDFRQADALRDQLWAMGVQLKDARDPASGDIVTTWQVRLPDAAEVEG
jgi:cysteinyl-tRNA synthetase